MNEWKKRSIGLLIMVACLAAGIRCLAVNVNIHTRNGRTQSGELLSITPQKAVIVDYGEYKEIRVDEITKITFGRDQDITHPATSDEVLQNAQQLLQLIANWPLPGFNNDNDLCYSFRPQRPCDVSRYREREVIRGQGISSYANLLVGNVTGRGKPNLLLTSNKRLISLKRNGHERTLASFRNPVHLDLLADINGDGLEETLVGGQRERMAFIAAVNHQGQVVREFSIRGSQKNKRFDTTLTALCVTDLNRDGQMELLAKVNSGYSQKPRGIICFDVQSGRKNWEYLCAPSVTDLAVADLDRDNQLEIIFGTYSPGNGAKAADGSDDMHTYIYCLNANGRLKWRFQTGGHFTGTYVSVLKNSRRAIARVSAGSDHRDEVGMIMEFNSVGKRIKVYNAGVTLNSLAIIPGRHDRQSQIIATDRKGYLHILRPQGDQARKVLIQRPEYNSLQSKIEAVADLSGNGRYNILLTVSDKEFISGRNPRSDRGPSNIRYLHNNGLLILNDQFERVTFLPVAQTWTKSPGFSARIADLNADGNLDILACSDRIQVFTAH